MEKYYHLFANRQILLQFRIYNDLFYKTLAAESDNFRFFFKVTLFAVVQ